MPSRALLKGAAHPERAEGRGARQSTRSRPRCFSFSARKDSPKSDTERCSACVLLRAEILDWAKRQ